MKKSIVLLIVATICMSCNKEEVIIGGGSPKGPFNQSSYIQGFYELNDIYISPSSGMIIDKKNNSVDFLSKTSFNPPYTYSLKDGIGLHIFIMNNEERLITLSTYKYNTLVNKIGDTSFNTSAPYGYSISHFVGVISVVDTIQTVTITCDKQFDADHPAGSSLNDLFTIYYEDPYSIIKNGYKVVPGENHYTVEDLSRQEGYPLYVVGSKLNEVSFDQILWIGASWYLVLEKEPERTDEYVFSISISNNNGKEVKGTASRGMKIKGNS